MKLITKKEMLGSYESVYDRESTLAEFTSQISESPLDVQMVYLDEKVELEQQNVTGSYSLQDFMTMFNYYTRAASNPSALTITFVGYYNEERVMITTQNKEDSLLFVSTKNPELNLEEIMEKKSEGMKM